MILSKKNKNNSEHTGRGVTPYLDPIHTCKGLCASCLGQI